MNTYFNIYFMSKEHLAPLPVESVDRKEPVEPGKPVEQGERKVLRDPEKHGEREVPGERGKLGEREKRG